MGEKIHGFTKGNSTFLREESEKWVGWQKGNKPLAEEVGVAVGHFLQMTPMWLLRNFELISLSDNGTKDSLLL